jgi:hypothetical protein
MKVVAVLYPGGAAADDPGVLGCAENALGLREFLEGRPIRDDYVMVADGEIQSGSYKAIYG